MPQNLFDIIARVTSRTEPFHSETLAWFLEASPALRRRFVEAVVPASFREKHGLWGDGPWDRSVVVRSEDPLATGERVDITLRWDTAVVGVEVKTVDGSSTAGQLERYWQRLGDKYPGRALHLVYLTPFSRTNAPEGVMAERLHGVQEFERFTAERPGAATHVDWNAVVELYPLDECEDGELVAAMRGHRDYVERVVCDGTTMARLDNARELGAFLGEETVRSFFATLASARIELVDRTASYRIELAQVADRFEELVAAIARLLDSGEVDRRRHKTDQLGEPTLRDAYLESEHGPFFTRLFEEVDRRGFAWLQGSGRIGVRVTHRRHGSGVSVCTLSRDAVEIAKRR